MKNTQRYKEIEKRMKKNINIKRFNQKEAVNYVKNL